MFAWSAAYSFFFQGTGKEGKNKTYLVMGFQKIMFAILYRLRRRFTIGPLSANTAFKRNATWLTSLTTSRPPKKSARRLSKRTATLLSKQWWVFFYCFLHAYNSNSKTVIFKKQKLSVLYGTQKSADWNIFAGAFCIGFFRFNSCKVGSVTSLSVLWIPYCYQNDPPH